MFIEDELLDYLLSKTKIVLSSNQQGENKEQDMPVGIVEGNPQIEIEGKSPKPSLRYKKIVEEHDKESLKDHPDNLGGQVTPNRFKTTTAAEGTGYVDTREKNTSDAGVGASGEVSSTSIPNIKMIDKDQESNRQEKVAFPHHPSKSEENEKQKRELTRAQLTEGVNGVLWHELTDSVEEVIRTARALGSVRKALKREAAPRRRKRRKPKKDNSYSSPGRMDRLRGKGNSGGGGLLSNLFDSFKAPKREYDRGRSEELRPQHSSIMGEILKNSLSGEGLTIDRDSHKTDQLDPNVKEFFNKYRGLMRRKTNPDGSITYKPKDHRSEKIMKKMWDKAGYYDEDLENMWEERKNQKEEEERFKEEGGEYKSKQDFDADADEDLGTIEPDFMDDENFEDYEPEIEGQSAEDQMWEEFRGEREQSNKSGNEWDKAGGDPFVNVPDDDVEEDKDSKEVDDVVEKFDIDEDTGIKDYNKKEEPEERDYSGELSPEGEDDWEGEGGQIVDKKEEEEEEEEDSGIDWEDSDDDEEEDDSPYYPDEDLEGLFEDIEPEEADEFITDPDFEKNKAREKFESSVSSTEEESRRNIEKDWERYGDEVEEYKDKLEQYKKDRQEGKDVEKPIEPKTPNMTLEDMESLEGLIKQRENVEPDTNDTGEEDLSDLGLEGPQIETEIPYLGDASNIVDDDDLDFSEAEESFYDKSEPTGVGMSSTPQKNINKPKQDFSGQSAQGLPDDWDMKSDIPKEPKVDTLQQSKQDAIEGLGDDLGEDPNTYEQDLPENVGENLSTEEINTLLEKSEALKPVVDKSNKTLKDKGGNQERELDEGDVAEIGVSQGLEDELLNRKEVPEVPEFEIPELPQEEEREIPETPVTDRVNNEEQAPPPQQEVVEEIGGVDAPSSNIPSVKEESNTKIEKLKKIQEMSEKARRDEYGGLSSLEELGVPDQQQISKREEPIQTDVQQEENISSQPPTFDSNASVLNQTISTYAPEELVTEFTGDEYGNIHMELDDPFIGESYIGYNVFNENFFDPNNPDVSYGDINSLTQMMNQNYVERFNAGE